MLNESRNISLFQTRLQALTFGCRIWSGMTKRFAVLNLLSRFCQTWHFPPPDRYNAFLLTSFCTVEIRHSNFSYSRILVYIITPNDNFDLRYTVRLKCIGFQLIGLTGTFPLKSRNPLAATGIALNLKVIVSFVALIPCNLTAPPP